MYILMVLNEEYNAKIQYNDEIIDLPHYVASGGVAYYVDDSLVDIFSNRLSVYVETSDLPTGCAGLFQHSNITGIYELNMKLGVSINHMFYDTPISNIDVLSTLDYTDTQIYTSAFYNCDNLVSVPDWDFGPEATQFFTTFTGCNNLTDVGVLDMRGTDYDKVYNGCVWMFTDCPKLTNIGGFKNLSVSIDLSDSLLLTRQSLLNIINSVAVIYNEDETPWIAIDEHVSSLLTDDEIALLTNKGWELSIMNRTGPGPDAGEGEM